MGSTAIGSSGNRTLSIACLVGGVVMLTLGVIAYDSVSSDFSRLFTNQPTDKAIWLLIGGTIATLAGLIGLARGGK